MFKPISSRINFPFQEEQTLNFWRLHRIFEKAGQQRQGAAEFVFYERPPAANSKPDLQHALGRACNDVFLRYQAMRGRQVIRRSGWDTHGLAIEFGVEKQVGLHSKAQIEAYGVAKFNAMCRKLAFQAGRDHPAGKGQPTIKEWERFIDRLGTWSDLSEAYVTYANEYIESVWWVFKALWDKGLLYQDFQAAPYCPRCGVSLAAHEIAQHYQEVALPSVYVRFPLVDERGASLLVWTSAPWTLPGNVAAAVHPEAEYVTVERVMEEGGRERLITARALVEQIFGEERVKILESYPGKKLKGRRYQPLFTFQHPDKPAHFVILDESVPFDDGTGLAHIAPTFDAQDLHLAQELDLPALLTVSEDGAFVPEVRPWSGKFVKDAEPFIIQDLHARGLLYKAGVCTRPQAFCWLCRTPLIDYAQNIWVLRSSAHKERLAALNQQIGWTPAHLGERFGAWLENGVDWTVGRQRYWGTPLPVWECEKCHHQLVVGSVDELSTLAGRDLSGLDLHRPYVDEIKFACPECRAPMRRVSEVLDFWFDAGAAPVAQWHFPFENRESYRQQFPADFVCEASTQIRGWFYALHTINGLLNDSPAFKNAVGLGLALDENGRPISGERGNLTVVYTAVDLWNVFSKYGADALRWYFYTAAQAGEEICFSIDELSESAHHFLEKVWNAAVFFVANANRDGWTPSLTPQTPLPEGDGGRNLPSPNGGRAGGEGLDRWLRVELHGLVRQVGRALESYDVNAAARKIQAFVDDFSGWYLRHARKRFWKSASSADKDAAYGTLYETLVTLSKLLAPLLPFLAEALHQNLVRSIDSAAPESVHMCDWPAGESVVLDPEITAEMQFIKKLAALGHAARRQAGVKERQPLAEAGFLVGSAAEKRAVERFAEVLAGELNVKAVRLLESKDEVYLYRLKPQPKPLGEKYKSQYSKVSQAILALDPGPAARALLAGQPIQVQAAGETLNIQPDEVEVHHETRSGLAVASDGVCLAALKTELTPALRRNAQANEVIHHIQQLRRQAELDIAERVPLYLTATPDLLATILEHQEIILNETYLSELIQSEPPAGAVSADAWFDGHWMKIAIKDGINHRK